MSSEWRKTTLGEISTPNKENYDVAASAVDSSDSLYTHLKITDINNGEPFGERMTILTEELVGIFVKSHQLEDKPYRDWGATEYEF